MATEIINSIEMEPTKNNYYENNIKTKKLSIVTPTPFKDNLKDIDEIVESIDPDPDKFVKPIIQSTVGTMTSSSQLHGTGGGGIGTHRHLKEQKIGHRRVTEAGEITYKKIQTSHIMGSIQLGIQYTVGSLASKPKRDLLMNDFCEIESISFPPDGSSITPAHHYGDFRFKIYAPIAFRYFRELFGIQPDDFMISMCLQQLRELSNPGASGSIFYLTDDDEFIIKTVQHKEGEFLQKLLPGYYMNLNQNPRTLLPKFFGLYCFQCNSKNVRLVVMNNLLPSCIKMHLKYDLKGSTFKRKASKQERKKESPTYKDLDFMEQHPNGIYLEPDTYAALMKTIQRDCTVLESFQIMDYSLLLGIHNLDQAAKERSEGRTRTLIRQNAQTQMPPPQQQQQKYDRNELDDAPEADQFMMEQQNYEGSDGQPNSLQGSDQPPEGPSKSRQINRHNSIYKSFNRQRLVAHSTAMESIQAESEPTEEDDEVPTGGIPARNEKGERLLLFIGIIDILQSYRLIKKLEHTFKSIIHDGDTVSVCRPSFYAQRFQNFMAKTVFKKIPYPIKQSPSKRKSVTTKVSQQNKYNNEQSAGSGGGSGMYSTPSTSSQSHQYYSTAAMNQQNQNQHGRNMNTNSNANHPNSNQHNINNAGNSGNNSNNNERILHKSTIKIPPRYSNNSAPSCSSTPPPAFDDISEKSLQRSNFSYDQQRSQDSSEREGNSDMINISTDDMDTTTSHSGAQHNSGSMHITKYIGNIEKDPDTVSISQVIVEKVSVRVERTIHIDESNHHNRYSVDSSGTGAGGVRR